jgi:hypothetical protein
MAASGFVIGIVLAICAAFTLALSMNVQQFALSAPIKHRILARWGRDMIWVGGLFLYLMAQGFLVAALNFGPQTLISAVFATVLLFDALIARFILRKEILATDALGLAVILAAVMVCAICGPNIDYDVSIPVVKNCITNPMGALFTMASFMFVCMLTKLVFVFEATYPLFRSPEVEELQMKNGVDAVIKPPKHVESLMMVIYPLALAVVEMGGQTTLKGFMGMVIFDIELVFTSGIFWAVACTWLCCVAGTVYGLRKVYAKFETVECLPIEYGVNTVLCIFAGLIFYQEHQYVDSTNLVIISVSACFVPVGVAIMVLGKRDAIGHEQNQLSLEAQLERAAVQQPSQHERTVDIGSTTPAQSRVSFANRVDGTRASMDGTRASIRRQSRLGARGGLALLPNPRKSINELAAGGLVHGLVAGFATSERTQSMHDTRDDIDERGGGGDHNIGGDHNTDVSSGRQAHSMTPWATDKRVLSDGAGTARFVGEGERPIGIADLMPTLNSWENGGAAAEGAAVGGAAAGGQQWGSEARAAAASWGSSQSRAARPSRQVQL